MSKKPVVSLIIPTYNCAGFLDETMGSVLDQLPDDCELIYVDKSSYQIAQDIGITTESLWNSNK